MSLLVESTIKEWFSPSFSKSLAPFVPLDTKIGGNINFLCSEILESSLSVYRKYVKAITGNVKHENMPSGVTPEFKNNCDNSITKDWLSRGNQLGSIKVACHYNWHIGHPFQQRMVTFYYSGSVLRVKNNKSYFRSDASVQLFHLPPHVLKRHWLQSTCSLTKRK